MTRMAAILLLWLTAVPLQAQDIAPGTWRYHNSFSSISVLTSSSNSVYAAAGNAIARIELDENRITTYTKQDGLPGSVISAMAVTTSDIVVTGYVAGQISIGLENPLILDPAAALNPEISRKINAITIHNNRAYLCTAYGVIVLDPAQKKILETWRDLGPAGTQREIFGIAFRGDSVYLATAGGLMSAFKDANLLDYNSWVFPETPLLKKSISFIAVNGTELLATIDNTGVIINSGTGWTLADFLQNSEFNSLIAGNSGFTISTGAEIWHYQAGTFTAVTQQNLTTALALTESGTLWVGDANNGILNGTQIIRPAGPTANTTFRLRKLGPNLAHIATGFTTLATPGNDSDYSYIATGIWNNVKDQTTGITDVTVYNGSTYIGSLVTGIVKEGTTPEIIPAPLQSIGLRKPVSALVADQTSLWVANPGGTTPIHVWSDGIWESFTVNESPLALRYPVDLVPDGVGNVWYRPDPSYGGLAFLNRTTKSVLYKTTTTGFGALPSATVTAAALDKNGYLWVGTDKGVAYFYDPEQDAIRPIFENRFLLKDETITAIAVDAGNRKWFGTTNGLWLFDATGEKLIAHFTQESSPLVSDKITAIEIEDRSGEVFIGTEQGLVSYRSDAAIVNPGYRLKVFPNPVQPDFNGLVGIEGSLENSVIRITDLGGVLVRELQSNGNAASWDLRDFRGRRPPAGIYLVFSINESKKETITGKIIIL